MITVLVVLALLLEIGDCLTTARALAHPGYKEANPIFAPIIARLGIWPAAAIKLALAGGAILIAAHFAAPWNALFLLALIGLLVWVVWHNWKIVR